MNTFREIILGIMFRSWEINVCSYLRMYKNILVDSQIEKFLLGSIQDRCLLESCMCNDDPT